ncbi:MAG: hypothetical protein ACKVQR_05485 [Aquabacterium sp.]
MSLSLRWKRLLVPKWRISTERPAVYGADTRRPPNPEYLGDGAAEVTLRKAIEDFESVPSVGTASDAMRFFHAEHLRTQIEGPARYLVEHRGRAIPDGLLTRASAVVGHAQTDEGTTTAREHTRRLRTLLRIYPENALAWMDLARLKTSEGDNESAAKHILAATTLAPGSRVVLRSAARFYAHMDNTELAIDLLRRSPRTKEDPWLLASEISLSSLAGRTSRLLKRGHGMLEARRFAAADTAELAGALAVEAVSSGESSKVIKRLFAASVIAPNDNALAQAQWAIGALRIESAIPEAWLDAPASAEAALYSAMQGGDLHRALDRALVWHVDEPWASRPLIAGSHLAALMGDYSASIGHAKTGLKLDPTNTVLLNNLAFSSLCEGNVPEAVAALMKVTRQKSPPDPHTLANVGLLAYMCGDAARGGQAYDEAVRRFEKRGDQRSAAMVRIFHAFAASRTSGVMTPLLLESAMRAAQGSNDLLVTKTFELLLAEPQSSHAPNLLLADELARTWLQAMRASLLQLQ